MPGTAWRPSLPSPHDPPLRMHGAARRLRAAGRLPADARGSGYGWSRPPPDPRVDPTNDPSGVMQSFLARCCLIAVLAAGFVCSGDAGRLLRAVTRVVNTTQVPGLAPGASAPGDGAAATGAPFPASPAAAPVRLDPGPAIASGRDAPVNHPIGLPPSDGPATVRLSELAAGSRVLVWIGHGTRRDPLRPVEVIALDLVDPVTGDVLEYRHAGTVAGDGPAVPPRRVRLPGGSVSKGADLERVPVGGLHTPPGGTPPQRIGPVIAVTIVGAE